MKTRKKVAMGEKKRKYLNHFPVPQTPFGKEEEEGETKRKIKSPGFDILESHNCHQKFIYTGARSERVLRFLAGVFADETVFDQTLIPGMRELVQFAATFRQLSVAYQKRREAKNLVTLSSVVKGVLLQQFVQATVALVLLTGTASKSGVVVQPSIPKQAVQIIVAMFIMDTWQYFVHRYMHQNKFLYRHVHSRHHRLVVPYAIGALYNHPLEGLVLDTFGGAISFLVSGMTARTAVVFFCFAVVKTVDDHCGLWLPWNIFHLFFQNNTAYHDIHHQLQGLKFNYSQPFFPIWDKLLGTHMPCDLVKRPEGGYEARPIKD
ncbi:hypothetical protein L6164_007452 [Bauhinia variegata]|uniref:Uncharacterized protein n=1 Tax=Bauhinia variegata TaxID=167791 RepID=A0ACB9PDL8_BAUVA|nr:hypothetical protein L6164_007452 [Bauhinia variegata]